MYGAIPGTQMIIHIACANLFGLIIEVNKTMMIIDHHSFINLDVLIGRSLNSGQIGRRKL